MARLTMEERKRLPRGRFGLPRERKYPLPDEAHARAALLLAAQFATPSERTEIESNIARLFPSITISK